MKPYYALAILLSLSTQLNAQLSESKLLPITKLDARHNPGQGRALHKKDMHRGLRTRQSARKPVQAGLSEGYDLAAEIDNPNPFAPYPNPATVKLSFTLHPHSQRIEAQIVDSSGNVVLTQPLALRDTHSLDIEGLRPGAYHLIVQDGPVWHTARIRKK